jgi:hypothetical protein
MIETFIYLNVLSCRSASARISKGQGFQGFLRKRAGSSFGPKWSIYVVQGKTVSYKEKLEKRTKAGCPLGSKRAEGCCALLKMPSRSHYCLYYFLLLCSGLPYPRARAQLPSTMFYTWHVT